MPASVPKVLAAWMLPFAVYFTTAVWRHVLVGRLPWDLAF